VADRRSTIAWVLPGYGRLRNKGISAHRSVRNLRCTVGRDRAERARNFGLLQLMQTHSKVAQMPALVIAALLAGLIGYLGSRIALK
jgi:hypothetical protein